MKVVDTVVVLVLEVEELFTLAVAVTAAPEVAEDGLGVASSWQSDAADFTLVP